jgi:hypothetical protein
VTGASITSAPACQCCVTHRAGRSTLAVWDNRRRYSLHDVSHAMSSALSQAAAIPGKARQCVTESLPAGPAAAAALSLVWCCRACACRFNKATHSGQQGVWLPPQQHRHWALWAHAYNPPSPQNSNSTQHQAFPTRNRADISEFTVQICLGTQEAHIAAAPSLWMGPPPPFLSLQALHQPHSPVACRTTMMEQSYKVLQLMLRGLHSNQVCPATTGGPAVASL